MGHDSPRDGAEIAWTTISPYRFCVSAKIVAGAFRPERRAETEATRWCRTFIDGCLLGTLVWKYSTARVRHGCPMKPGTKIVSVAALPELQTAIKDFDGNKTLAVLFWIVSYGIRSQA